MKEGMFTKMSSLNEFHRTDEFAAQESLIMKAYTDLKKMKWTEEDIDQVIKVHAIDISWQAHVAGYKDVIIEQDESDDSDSSDDLRSRMNSRMNARKKIEEKSTPTKKKKKRGVA